MFTLERREGYVKPVINTGKGLTKQEFKKECDVNEIMRKYQKTGVMTFVSNVNPEFMETSPLTFLEAMNIVENGQDAFMQLPSSVRKLVDNDPAKFLEFVQSEENKEQVYALGLAKRPAPEPTPSSEVPTTPVETPAPAEPA